MDELMELLKESVPNVDFENSKNYVADGLLDSLGIVEVIAAIEDKYQITIEGEDIDPDNFVTVEKMWGMILKCSGK